VLLLDEADEEDEIGFGADLAVAEKHGLTLHYERFECGGAYYLKHGKEWEPEAFPYCRDEADAIMLGAAEDVIKDWEDIIAINLTGVFNVTHAFLESLRAAKGRIVNIGSIQSFVHLRTPSSPAYTASKHGVLGFTKALAAELGAEGVRVNAIGPGFIETPLNEKVRASNPELAKTFIAHTPLGRAGKAEDIVGPAIFLASDLSAYVSGTIVMLDGGYRTI